VKIIVLVVVIAMASCVSFNDILPSKADKGEMK